jgi:hypothetical protein
MWRERGLKRKRNQRETTLQRPCGNRAPTHAIRRAAGGSLFLFLCAHPYFRCPPQGAGLPQHPILLSASYLG